MTHSLALGATHALGIACPLATSRVGWPYLGTVRCLTIQECADSWPRCLLHPGRPISRSRRGERDCAARDALGLGRGVAREERPMPCRLPVILALIVALLHVPGLTLAQDDPLQATTRTVNVELILDASGSMAEALPDGETRITAAKRILSQVIQGLPEREGVNVGLRVYGHLGDNTETGKPVSCRSSELLVPIAGVDKPLLTQTVEAIQPTGWTPIAYALEQAAADFQPGGESVTNAIVLVTDGEETCDPPEQACQAAAALRQAGIAVTTHVVGFALTEQQTTQVRCIAEQGGGQLFGADDAAGLGTAIGSALEGVGVSITPVATTPAAVPPVAMPPIAAPVPLADIRTLAYHQL